MSDAYPKCGTIEGTSTYPALDVAVCSAHGEALQVNVATDPSSPRHGHHRECLACLVQELYGVRGRAPDHRPGPVPNAYEAVGDLRIADLVVTLEDQAGVRWPLAILLEELTGRRVRIQVAPAAEASP
jgi:hypothetical protein